MNRTPTQQSRRIFAAAAGIVLAIILLGVASAWLPNRGAHELRPPAAPAEKLTIAINSPYLGSALVSIAAAKEYFLAESLTVTLQPHTTGLAALESVIRGEADLATVAETPFMFAVMRGEPISLIATISSESRNHALVARKDRGVRGPADLKGKRVGTTIGTTSHFLVDAILVAHKTSSRDIVIVNLKPEQMVDAVTDGAVDRKGS